jgi:hypothetical protein
MAPKKAKKTADSINSRLALGTFFTLPFSCEFAVCDETPQYVADSCLSS